MSSTSTYGMIEVGPVAADLGDLVVHEPAQQVEHVRRLVDQHAAPLGVPLAAPGVGPVVRLVAPAIHRERAQHRPADLAGVDRLLHPPHRLVPPPLADDAELDPVLVRAAASIASQSSRLAASGFSTRTCTPASAATDRRPGVQRVRRADEDRLDAGLREHRRHVGVRPHAVPRRRTPAARSRSTSQTATNSDSGKRRERLGVDLADLAAADQGGPHSVSSSLTPGKYFALIRRRNASDSAISSMPFMPSSMLTQPWYRCSARMRKIAS